MSDPDHTDPTGAAPRGGFWLIFIVYVAGTLVALGIPVDLFAGVSILGPLLLLMGAVGGVIFKRRDPVASNALAAGFVVAFGIGLVWFMTHLKIVLP